MLQISVIFKDFLLTEWNEFVSSYLPCTKALYFFLVGVSSYEIQFGYLEKYFSQYYFLLWKNNWPNVEKYLHILDNLC